MKPQELFDALERGEKIECYEGVHVGWAPWKGISWSNNWNFRIVKPEPVLVPHWHAVIDGPSGCWLSYNLYATIDAARNDYDRAIRLATEYPAIMLEVKK